MKIRHNSMIGGDDDGADAAPALMCNCTPPDLQMPPTLKEAQIALDRTPSAISRPRCYSFGFRN